MYRLRSSSEFMSRSFQGHIKVISRSYQSLSPVVEVPPVSGHVQGTPSPGTHVQVTVVLRGHVKVMEDQTVT